jgi:hypothetical protein
MSASLPARNSRRPQWCRVRGQPWQSRSDAPRPSNVRCASDLVTGRWRNRRPVASGRCAIQGSRCQYGSVMGKLALSVPSPRPPPPAGNRRGVCRRGRRIRVRAREPVLGRWHGLVSAADGDIEQFARNGGTARCWQPSRGEGGCRPTRADTGLALGETRSAPQDRYEAAPSPECAATASTTTRTRPVNEPGPR